MKIVLETARLRLREYTEADFGALYAILSDPETMRHYPRPYDEAGTRRWLDWCFDSCAKHGFGLWAVDRKAEGDFIGDCGITLQHIDGEILPEIGYHIRRDCWRQGFAKEAARAVRDWAFRRTDFPALDSYMVSANAASTATALSIGMRRVKAFTDPHGVPYTVCAITRAEWEALQ